MRLSVASVAMAALCSSCGGYVCDVCPPPVYATADVRGVVFRANGQPAAGQQVYVGACSGAVGHYDTQTRSDGSFDLRLVHEGAFDTTTASFPPDTNGYFTLSACRARALAQGSPVATWDSVPVRFARVGVPTPVTWLELREP